MKVAVIVALFAAFATASAIRKVATKFADHNKVAVTHDEDSDYNNYVNAHHPNYKKDKYHSQRVAKFKSVRQAIIDHDPDAEGYAKGFTKFAHMTDEEVDKQWNKALKKKKPSFIMQYARAPEFETRAAPASIDWRTQNAVTSVKDQGQCGSCYTFAAAAALEGAYAKKFGKLIDISTQQYVDCSTNYGFDYVWNSKLWQWDLIIVPNADGNAGCDGGYYQACWGYNNLTATQNSWSCYGYVSGNTEAPGSCAPKTCSTAVKPTGFVNLYNETDLLNAVANVGPVACALDATPLMYYTGGIIDGTQCSTSSNHAITVVGYGTNSTGTPYWIVKNSWGTSWGENGYFRIKRGVNACGIGTNWCAFPTF